MSFKDAMSSLPRQSGHNTFHDVFDVTATAQGTERLKEILVKYPVLTGMLDALHEQLRLDQAKGVRPEDLDNISLGFGMAVGVIALIAESEIPNTNQPHS